MSDGISNLGTLIGQASADATSTSQTQALAQDVGSSYFIFGNYGLKILNTQVLAEYQSVGNSFILGSSVHGILGSSTLGLSTIWGNANSLWGTALWGGTTGTWSTISSSTLTQPLTSVGLNTFISWFGSVGGNPPTYVAIGLGLTYLELFTTTTYKDSSSSTATWSGGTLTFS